MAAMARQQISPVIAERRCPNCGTRVARDAESCFMCGHDLRIQRKRRQRVSWIDALLVLAVLVVLAAWWRIASQPRPDSGEGENVAVILPTNPMLTATVPVSVALGIETPTPLPTALPNGVIRHRVREGETLVSIATLYGVTVEEIQSANNLTDALIRTGDELIVPVSIPETASAGGSTVQSRFEYTVQPGDTIISIANRFGSTVEEIVIVNSLTANDFIRPGDVLMIPVREVPAEVLASTEGAAPSDPGTGAIYAEPRPIGPANEESFAATESILLRWVSVDVLAPNEWYVLLIYPISGPARTFPSIWTKTTSYTLDPEFAPTTGETAVYAWQVSVVRVMPGVNNQYALEAASPPSELRSFSWR
jgi:LysM repeat protein/predicted nucleic acid-binding Zn ribbon protein